MISDKYKEIRKINTNNFSEIYEVADISTNKHFAMKIIKGINSSLNNVILSRGFNKIKNNY